MNKIRIGTGGIPLTSPKRDTVSGINFLKELALDHFEVEFVRSVYIKEEVAGSIKDAAEKADISITIHAPYYINLASDVPKTFYGSINHIVKSLYIGGLIGAKSVTYHSAYFQKKDPEAVADQVLDAVKKIHREVLKKNTKLKMPVSIPMIAPELTGKPSQFGSVEELVTLAKKLKQEDVEISLCIDFAHYFARTNAEYNAYDQFSNTIEYIRDNLGDKAVQNLHMHISGIIHSPKGERHHVTLLSSLEEYKDSGIEVDGIDASFNELIKKEKNGGSEFNWQGVLKALKAQDVGGYLVCESPIMELDALLIQRIYDTL